MSRQETNIERGHAAEADGIEEYDNPLPAWWLGLLYATIVFGIVYAADYHLISHHSAAGDYDAEMAAWKLAHPPKQPSAIAAGSDTSAGRAIFAANCVGCHGVDAHGGVGPNLTDTTWIHGGTLPEITTTITNGVPPKGMLTWGPILGPDKIAEVAAYVHGLGGGQ